MNIEDGNYFAANIIPQILQNMIKFQNDMNLHTALQGSTVWIDLKNMIVKVIKSKDFSASSTICTYSYVWCDGKHQKTRSLPTASRANAIPDVQTIGKEVHATACVIIGGEFNPTINEWEYSLSSNCPTPQIRIYSFQEKNN